MAFITDITIFVDEAKYEEPGRLKKILQSYNPEKKGGSYCVRGTFEELDHLSVTLSAQLTTNQQIGQKHKHAPAGVLHVDVSEFVMGYIQQKCGKELSKIQGNSFVIETQRDLRSANNCSGTVRVSIRPRHDAVYAHHVDYVRQRFITFYQRTASDLQVTSVPLSPHDHKELQRRFPQLIFNPSQKCHATVTGTFAHIAKLREFLSYNTQSSNKGLESKGPADIPSGRTISPQRKLSRDPEAELCPVCMEPIVMSERETLQCQHSFCRECLQNAFSYKPVCPTCGKLYGTLTGTQPDGGTMEVFKDSSSLPGYEKYGTLIIQYYIPDGTQTEEHPNPGHLYKGVARTAFLPDSSEGRRILKLLRRAFDQRLIFTVGRSTTTGRNNIVTWNDIHHKTSTHGGPTRYGYPDPDYLSRVADELKAKGIE